MCLLGRLVVVVSLSVAVFNGSYAGGAEIGNRDVEQVCLLYTSDAADD